MYRCDRADGYGVFITCQESLVSCSLEIDNNFCELVARKVKLFDNSNLVVCSVYCPPSSSDDYLYNLCKHLGSIKTKHPNSAIWIAGDINLPDINWQDNYVEGHQYSLCTNNIFLDFLNNNGLTQVVDFPTRGANTLDIFVTNRLSQLESCKAISDISDHEGILTKSLILNPPANIRVYL